MALLSTERRRAALWGYFFVAPQLLGLLVFTLGPLVAGVGVSFWQWNMLTPPRFTGLANYAAELADPQFWNALRNTLYYAVVEIPISVALALTLALALNHRFGKLLYRTIYFAPVVTSSVAVAVIWTWMYNPDYGVFNALLGYLNVTGPTWLQSTTWVMPSIILTSVWWGTGYTMVLFLAGLQGIPDLYYEAARIDGAGRAACFRHITLPLLSPTTFFVLIIAVIGAFQVFDQVYVMTNGGPGYASDVFMMYLYRHAFVYFQMGRASAEAMVLFLVTLVVTLLQFRMSQRWVHYTV